MHPLRAQLFADKIENLIYLLAFAVMGKQDYSGLVPESREEARCSSVTSSGRL